MVKTFLWLQFLPPSSPATASIVLVTFLSYIGVIWWRILSKSLTCGFLSYSYQISVCTLDATSLWPFKRFLSACASSSPSLGVITDRNFNFFWKPVYEFALARLKTLVRNSFIVLSKETGDNQIVVDPYERMLCQACTHILGVAWLDLEGSQRLMWQNLYSRSTTLRGW